MTALFDIPLLSLADPPKIVAVHLVTFHHSLHQRRPRAVHHLPPDCCNRFHQFLQSGW